MLLIMLSGMMHNVVPHSHHKHDIAGNIEFRGDSHHHDHPSDHHHHHSDENEREHEKKNFLNFLFENHSHSQHTHQNVLVNVEYAKSAKQGKIKVFGSFGFCDSIVRDIDLGSYRYMVFNESGFGGFNSPINLLRGPPSLG